MCIDCYRRYSSPMIVSDATLLAAASIDIVFSYSAVGGNLHAILDDWNLEDEFFEDGFKNWSERASEDQVAAERACFDRLRGMSVDERASSLAIYDGFLSPPPRVGPPPGGAV